MLLAAATSSQLLNLPVLQLPCPVSCTCCEGPTGLASGIRGYSNCGTKTERIQLWAVTKPNMTSSRPNDAVLKAKAAQHPKAEGDLTTTNANEVGAALAVLQAQFELNSTDLTDLTWNSTNLTWKSPLRPKPKLGWYGLSKPGLCDVKCQPRPCCICM